MSNHNNFDDMIQAAREQQVAERAKAQREEDDRQRGAEQMRVLVLQERQKTLQMARYAAQLFVAHNVAPTVRLQDKRQISKPWSARPTLFELQMFRWPTGGWPVVYTTHLEPTYKLEIAGHIPTGFLQMKTTWQHVYDGGDVLSQGIVLTPQGLLMQYVATDHVDSGQVVAEEPVEKGLIRSEFVTLPDDPRNDRIIWWHLGRAIGRASVGVISYVRIPELQFDYALHHAEIPDSNDQSQYGSRNIEAELQWQMTQLVARSIPGQEPQQ